MPSAEPVWNPPPPPLNAPYAPVLAPPGDQKRGGPMVAIVGFVMAAIAAVAAYQIFGGSDLGPPPTPQEVDAAFVAVPGYEYQAAPAELKAELNESIEASPDLKSKLDNYDVRLLSTAGRPQAVVAILSVDPDELEGDTPDSVVKELGTGGFRASHSTLEGEDVYTGVIFEVTVTVFASDDGLVFMVLGPHPNLVKETSTELIKATNSLT